MSNRNIEYIVWGLNNDATGINRSSKVHPPVGVANHWSLEAYIDAQGLDQAIVLKSTSNDAYLMSAVGGCLYFKGTSLELHVTELNHNDAKWWPFPSPVDSKLDVLIETPKVRPLPGRIVYNVKTNANTVKSIYRKVVEVALLSYLHDFLVFNARLNKTLLFGYGMIKSALALNALDGIFNQMSSSTDSVVKDEFNKFINYVIRYNTKRGVSLKLSSGSTFAQTLDFIVNHDYVGVFIRSGMPIGKVPVDIKVEVTSQDWRCYGHPFHPFAILEGKDVNGVDLDLNRSAYSKVYLRSSFGPNLPSSLSPSEVAATSGDIYNLFKGPYVGGYNDDAVSGWNNYTKKRYRFDTTFEKVLAEETVVLGKSNGNGIDLVEVRLDRYEKWSLFSSALRTIYSHWLQSGLLDKGYVENSVLLSILEQRIRKGKHKMQSDDNVYLSKYYAYNETTDSMVSKISKSIWTGTSTGVIPSGDIDFPLPKISSFIDPNSSDKFSNFKIGSDLGVATKNCNYDIQRFKLFCKGFNSREYFISATSQLRPVPRSNDAHKFFKSMFKGKIRVAKLGAYGLEEYTTRVALTEVANAYIGGPFDEKAGDFALKRIDFITTQRMVARTYTMGRLIGEKKYTYDYKDLIVPVTVDFHVMALGFLNTIVRQRKHPEQAEKVRLALEDSMYEDWGMVFKHRGAYVEAAFKGTPNDPGRRSEQKKSGSSSSATQPRYSALRGVFVPTQHGGSGYAQRAGKMFVETYNMSAHQNIHWFFFGAQIVADWGMGSVVSAHQDSTKTDPTSKDCFPWMSYKSGDLEVKLPSNTTYKDSGVWLRHNTAGSVVDGDFPTSVWSNEDEDWLLSFSYPASKFKAVDYSDSNGTVSRFMVRQELVFKLQRLWYKLQSSPPEKIKLVLPFAKKLKGKISSFKDVKIDGNDVKCVGANSRFIYRNNSSQINKSIMNSIFGAEGKKWIEIYQRPNYYYLVQG